jgi:hypothetical protein
MSYTFEKAIELWKDEFQAWKNETDKLRKELEASHQRESNLRVDLAKLESVLANEIETAKYNLAQAEEAANVNLEKLKLDLAQSEAQLKIHKDWLEDNKKVIQRLLADPPQVKHEKM